MQRMGLIDRVQSGLGRDVSMIKRRIRDVFVHPIEQDLEFLSPTFLASSSRAKFL